MANTGEWFQAHRCGWLWLGWKVCFGINSYNDVWGTGQHRNLMKPALRP